MCCLRRLQLQLQLLICFTCCLQLLTAARVYMEFNGQRHEYNTDNAMSASSELSPNYEVPDSQHWPYDHRWNWMPQSLQSMSSAPLASPHQPRYNINLHTPQMSHTQHTDAAGHVLGKYSYYDEAGYHELSYKAGAGIGFVVMGGNLAKPTYELN